MTAEQQQQRWIGSSSGSDGAEAAVMACERTQSRVSGSNNGGAAAATAEWQKRRWSGRSSDSDGEAAAAMAGER